MAVPRIAVEVKYDPRCKPFLDNVAATLSELGYDVVRWNGPYAWLFKIVASRVPQCDGVVVWNGLQPRYRRPMADIRRRGITPIFVELGWYPQGKTFQVDLKGINYGAGWVRSEVEAAEHHPLKLPAGEDLLVVLQLDEDTQITEYSPHFPNMRALVQHLVDHSELPVRVRAHPLQPVSQGLRQALQLKNCHFDESPNMQSALSNCRAVACINSSAAVEAMAHGLPVLCYGQAVYRCERAVYMMDGSGDQTRQVTRELQQGRTQLEADAVAEVLQRIRAAQWEMSELPKRLPPLLEQAGLGLPQNVNAASKK